MSDEGNMEWRKELEAARLEVERARLVMEGHKIAIERERTDLQRHQAHINRWAAEIGPQHTYIVESAKAAIGFGLAAIRSLFILNGGALAGLAPLRSVLRDLNVPNGAIVQAAVAFTIGLVLVTLTVGLAYLSQSAENAAGIKVLTTKAIRLKAPPEMSEAQICSDPEYVTAETARAKYFRWFNYLRVACVLTASASLASFVTGAWSLLFCASPHFLGYPIG